MSCACIEMKISNYNKISIEGLTAMEDVKGKCGNGVHVYTNIYLNCVENMKH